MIWDRSNFPDDPAARQDAINVRKNSQSGDQLIGHGYCLMVGVFEK
jgi:hypothetical protein